LKATGVSGKLPCGELSIEDGSKEVVY